MTSRAPDAAAARPGRACPHPSSRTRAPGRRFVSSGPARRRNAARSSAHSQSFESALVASLDEVGGGGVGPGAADEARGGAAGRPFDEGAIEDGDGLGGPSGGGVGSRRGVNLGRGDERVGGRGDVGGAARGRARKRARARVRVRVRVAAEVEAEARTLTVAIAAPHGRRARASAARDGAGGGENEENNTRLAVGRRCRPHFFLDLRVVPVRDASQIARRRNGGSQG